MTPQRHTILRQVVEVTVESEDRARRVHDSVGELSRARMLPILERECNGRGDPGVIHRIERLELDLGRLPADDFAAAFSAGLEREVGPGLARAIRAAERTAGGAEATRTASRIELLDTFLRTGTIPWWADGSDPALLATSLRGLAEEVPPQLAAWIRRVAREPAALRRLVLNCGEPELRLLPGLVCPAGGEALAELPAVLVGLTRTGAGWHGRTAEAVRRAAWAAVLLTVAAEHPSSPEPGALLREALSQVATAVQVPYPDLVVALRLAAGQGSAGLSRDLVGSIATLAGEERVAPEPAPGAAPAELLASLGRVAGSRTPWSGLLAVIAPSLDRFTGLLGARLREWLSSIAPGGPAALAPAAAEVEGAIPWLAPALASGVLSPEPVLQWVERVRAAGVSGIAHWTEPIRDLCARPGGASRADEPPETLFKNPGARLCRPRPAAAGCEFPAHWTSDCARRLVFDPAAPLFQTGSETRAAADAGFGEACALYVDNAGLVVLWPFLVSFFAHLGLSEARRFKDARACHRAVGLLDFLTTGDRLPREHRLPLNKILCGLELEEVFDFGEPVTDDERTECDHLLAGAIEQAPVLRQMSLAGFCSTFLVRPGQLTVRDGAWLLRVERQTYDVVLDRFPWSVHWVRLPWMPAPLQVEW